MKLHSCGVDVYEPILGVGMSSRVVGNVTTRYLVELPSVELFLKNTTETLILGTAGAVLWSNVLGHVEYWCHQQWQETYTLKIVILNWFQNDGTRGLSKDQLKRKQLSPTFQPNALVVFRAKMFSFKLVFREPPSSIIHIVAINIYLLPKHETIKEP